jgi:hypothetical protein
VWAHARYQARHARERPAQEGQGGALTQPPAAPRLRTAARRHDGIGWHTIGSMACAMPAHGACHPRHGARCGAARRVRGTYQGADVVKQVEGCAGIIVHRRWCWLAWCAGSEPDARQAAGAERPGSHAEQFRMYLWTGWIYGTVPYICNVRPLRATWQVIV